MKLLTEGIQTGAVIKTAASRKLTLDGITSAYPVYQVRLDLLFYNDQNDRIATWISKYRSEHGGRMPDAADADAYNAIIEDFILQSNPEAIKKTQANIELVNQREPGVTLNDGRIIDGNRRFTCLRRLAAQSDRFGHFETVIIDRSIEQSAKQIKMLELSIQHGEESKVDYNTIDRLVGVYQDVVETGLLSVAEYARSANESESDVKKRIETARLMVEFLEFINAPKQFHLARDMQISFPLEELGKLLKKCSTEDEAEDLKNCVFVNMLMKTSGDLGRFVRGFKNILGSDYQAEFIEEQKEIAEKVLETLPPRGQVNDRVIRDVMRANQPLLQALESSMDKAILKTKKTETRNRPIQLAEKATLFLEEIDLNILMKLGDSELQRLSRQLDKLERAAQEIRDRLYD